MHKMVIPYTTGASSGAAAVLGERSLLGKLYAVEYQPGDTATGATVTVSCENGVLTRVLLAKATAGTADSWYYPRDLVHATADGSALTGSSGGDRCEPLLAGTPKVTIASGDNSKSGKVILYFED